MQEFPPSIPFDDPILVFALAVTCFLIAPLILEHYRLPGIVGIILVGALIGPNGLGILERDATIVLLGSVGVVYLMFVVGLEINLSEFRKNRSESVGFGLLSFVIPQIVGTLVGVYLLGFGWLSALLFASVFASHTLLSYPIVKRLGIGENRAITTTMGGTILTDTLALLVLAVVGAATLGDLSLGFWAQLIGGLIVFFVGTWYLVPRIGRWFFRTVPTESYFEFLFVVALAFIAAVGAEFVGIEGIIGAFLAGLAINPLVPRHGVLMNRVGFVGNALFIPFFLLSIGMLVDISLLLEGWATIIITAVLIVLTLVTKLLAAIMAGVFYGYSHAEIGSMFGLSVGQAAAALAVTLVGFELGLFSEAVVNAVILMILAISIVAPVVTNRSGRRLVQDRDHTVEEIDEPNRILLPFSEESYNRDALLDIGLALRPASSRDPLYAVTIVKPDTDIYLDDAVASIERSLVMAEEHVAGAEVALDTQTRIANNVASGIARSATENRISTIVMGWDGAQTRSQSLFGSVIDRVLRQSNQELIVTGIRQQPNLTGRMVLIMPPGSVYSRGLPRSLRNISRLSREFGAPIDAYVFSEDEDRARQQLDAYLTGIELTLTTVDTWDAIAEIVANATAEDMLIAISARRDHVGWHRNLRLLPQQIAASPASNFAIVYPAVIDDSDERRFFNIK